MISTRLKRFLCLGKFRFFFTAAQHETEANTNYINEADKRFVRLNAVQWKSDFVSAEQRSALT